VYSSYGDIECGPVCSAPYPELAISLYAKPDAGSVFSGWAGDCSGTDWKGCSFWTNRPIAVTAVFTRTYPLTVNKTGPGLGIVLSEPEGLACEIADRSCTASFAEGTVVIIHPTMVEGTTFGGWGGDCYGPTGDCVMIMDAARTVVVDFDVIYTSVSVGVQGGGTVTSDPPGVSCSSYPGATCSVPFPQGTRVQLQATPSAGWVFSGWSGGGCGGTGDCVIALADAVSVTATFTPAPGPTITPSIRQNDGWFTELWVKLDNTRTITALSVNVVAQKTPGLSYNNLWDSVGGAIQHAHATTPTAISFTATLKPGQTIAPGTGRTFAAQMNGTGKLHPTAGDTWSVTYTVDGKTTTQTGHF
jgi:hypothetical protein